MKLYEFLAERNPEEMIYLGSKCSFIWIGTAAEIIEKLDELNNIHLQRINNRIKRCIGNIRGAANRVILYKECDIEAVAMILKNTHTELHELKNIRDEWTHLRDREVKSTYPHDIIKPYGLVVLFEGNEHGDYWLYEEVPKN